ncbi:nicolin-1 isoform X3 [Stigmatopora argus]
MSEGVACTVKPPVFLGSGGGSSASVRLSGVCVVDVLLPPAKTVDIESISFKNFYTASLSVRLLRRGPGREGEGAGSSAKWCTALRDRPLMTNPHTEGGAHDYCHIHWKQLRTSAERVSCVRLILKQPSRCWSRFGVEDVRLCPRAPLAEPDKELSDWLLALDAASPPTQGPTALSRALQRMWALSQVTQASQTSADSASVGRFDVDGCYNIQSLSLT